MSETPSPDRPRKRSKEPPPEWQMQLRAHRNQGFLSHCYMVTYHNDTIDEVEANINKYPELFQYAVAQCEFIARTGNKHWQVYIEFKQLVSPDFVKKRIFAKEDTHVQRTRVQTGDTFEDKRAKCRQYCMKKRTRSSLQNAGPFEWGEWLESNPVAEMYHNDPVRAVSVASFP
jgi:hypothetical protein